MNARSEATGVAVIQKEIQSMEGQLIAALPSHVSVKKFARVMLTAIGLNPDLATADRRTLWAASLKCASDGLLPDGREAVLVAFRSNDGPSQVSYIPMYQGILKRARQSGEIANWSVHCVYEKDEFTYELGDFERLVHKPFLGDRGNIIGAYSIVTLSSGERSREFMSMSQITAVRNRSKAKCGPWISDTGEMCRKVVLKRHAKRIPMSTEVDELLHRDDDSETPSPAPAPAPEIDITPQASELEKPKRPRALQSVVDSEPPIDTDVAAPAEEAPV